MIIDTNAQYTIPVTDEERSLIDDFIAKNGVTKVDRGVSGLPDPTIKMHWKDQREIQRRVYRRKKKFERAAEKRTAGKQSAGGKHNYAEAAFSALQDADGPLASRDVMERLGVSKPTAIRALKRLVEQGKIEAVGASIATRYRVAA